MENNIKINKYLELKLDIPAITIYSLIVFDVLYFMLFDHLLYSNNHISQDDFGTNRYVNEFTNDIIGSANWLFISYLIWGLLIIVNVVAVYLLYRYYKSKRGR
jgi:uncharacterized membrane protein